jgi:hypothetical protein
MGELESVPLPVRISTGDVKAAYSIDPAVPVELCSAVRG